MNFSGGAPLNTQRQSIKEVAVELKSINAGELAENPSPVVEIENNIDLYQVQSMSKYHDNLRDVAPFKDQAITNRGI